MKKILLVAIGAMLIMSCAKKTTDSAVKFVSNDSKNSKNLRSGGNEILWDEWGVPHIYADSDSMLFYGMGWAQMTSHANTILKLYGKSRGRAAEYWGAEYLENDMMVHALNFLNIGKRWYNQQSPMQKANIDAFIAGMNAYATKHPEAIDPAYAMVLPLESNDMMYHSLFVMYSRFVGGGDLRQLKNWEEAGSNSYAIAPKRSASGNSMLVMNPHLPWYEEWLFYEAHCNTPDMNTYGTTVVGLPVLGIAFNENLGWTHTVNTIDNADRYEITIKDGQYEVDGEWKDLRAREDVIKVKNGAKLDEKEMTFYSTPEHGYVLKQSGDKALTIKMAGMENSAYGVDQWWRMGKSKSLGEFKSSLRRLQVPYFNIVYADKEGNIFYMFNGQVPVRKTGDFHFWDGIVDGSKSENLWSEVHSYNDMPKYTNPESGWIQNANDPPWTSTFPNELKPEDYPAYMAPVEMHFRPQIAAKMIHQDTMISFDELVDYKHSTRIEMADRILDDLYAAIEEYGGDDAKEAKTVLMNWDRHANADSKGMALFYQWAWALGPYKQGNYATKWSIDKALTTPDGLANPEMAVKALEGVVAKMKAGNVPLDIPWGAVYRIKKGDVDIPGHGADGSVGIFRVAWSAGPQADGKSYISGGDSFQAVIEFGEKVKAKVQMSYSNSTQPNSPHYTDQLQLFADKKLRDCYFYREDVLQHVKKRDILKMK